MKRSILLGRGACHPAPSSDSVDRESAQSGANSAKSSKSCDLVITLSNQTGRGWLGGGVKRHGGFVLAETLISVAVSVISFAGFYMSCGQAIRLVRAAKETGYASEMLQRRIEDFRFSPPWTNMTTVAGIISVVSPPTEVAKNFSGVTETFTVVPYPAGGTPLVVTRSPNGSITSSGPDLSNQRCIKLTVAASWTGTSNFVRTRQIATIVAKGGL